jgi:hypothetical protein
MDKISKINTSRVAKKLEFNVGKVFEFVKNVWSYTPKTLLA